MSKDQKEKEYQSVYEKYLETYKYNHITKCRHYLELIFLNKYVLIFIFVILVLLTIAAQSADFIYLTFAEFSGNDVKTAYLVFFLINYVAVFLANYWWTFPLLIIIFYGCITVIYYVAQIGIATGTAVMMAPPM